MSKSSFEQYNEDIIQINTHRINSLRLSNVFIDDLNSTPFLKISNFVRIERFVIDNIESKYLQNVLSELVFLPVLSSMSITCIGDVRNTSAIYYKIFRLSALKYCKLSLEEEHHDEPLLIATNQYSPIEHLVIECYRYLPNLSSLLSYVPQIRRLSLNTVYMSWMRPTQLSAVVLNHLMHVSFRLHHIDFDQFEQLIGDRFLTIEVLRISIRYSSDPTYLIANRWKQLISFRMTNLRIFDIEVDVSVGNNDNQLPTETQIKEFASPFWIERQWFFQFHSYQRRNRHCIIFYSTNPYRYKYIRFYSCLFLFFRRKDYTLYEQFNENPCLRNTDSVTSVHIKSQKSIKNCINYFSNATELTFHNNFPINHNSIATSLSNIIPLNHLTKLTIECHRFAFGKVVELLSVIPNIHTLILKSMPIYTNEYLSIQQNRNFQFVSNINSITNVTIEEKCTLEQLQLLVALCPRLEHIKINPHIKSLELILRFIFDKTNHNTRHLFSLIFFNIEHKCRDKPELLIKSEKLIENYLIMAIHRRVYLWW
jgi:hypothetical protein